MAFFHSAPPNLVVCVLSSPSVFVPQHDKKRMLGAPNPNNLGPRKGTQDRISDHLGFWTQQIKSLQFRPMYFIRTFWDHFLPFHDFLLDLYCSVCTDCVWEFCMVWHTITILVTNFLVIIRFPSSKQTFNFPTVWRTTFNNLRTSGAPRSLAYNWYDDGLISSTGSIAQEEC